MNTLMRSVKLQTRLLEIIIRMMVWLLLTGQFTVENILIGLIISMALPPITKRSLQLKPLLALILNSPRVLAKAYSEAFTLILNGYQDRPSKESVKIPSEFRKNQLLSFLWIVLLTITPRSIVVNETTEEIMVQSQRMR